MRFIKHHRDPDELNITPLIDIVFILLIFFAVSSTFVKDMQIELRRPNAETSVPASSTAVRLYLDPGGVMFIDGKTVRPRMLQTEIREALDLSPGKTVLIITDGSTPAEYLIDAVDQCKLAGAAEVAVATEFEE